MTSDSSARDDDGRLRLVEENGAEFARKLLTAMRVVSSAMDQINAQADEMKPIADSLKSFGRVSKMENDSDSESF